MESRTLPIIDSCRGCGACCMTQGSPPGYVGFLSGVFDPDSWPDADDDARYRTMPEPALRSLRVYLERLRAGTEPGDQPCCWFDPLMKRCRFYEHRPEICREMEVGGESCLGWRGEFGIA